MERIPATPQTKASKRLRTLHRRARKGTCTLSLKEFVRVNPQVDEEVTKLGQRWFHNKTANFSNPPLGIGRTNRVKKNPGGKK